jgi:allantoin racemase
MRKIMVVAPGEFDQKEIEIRQSYLNSICSENTSVIVMPAEGIDSLKSIADGTLLAVGVLKRVVQANREGFDAVVIHCFADPGLEAAKTQSNIPVFGGAETTYHVASLLADRFGVVTLGDWLIPYLYRQAKLAGMVDKVASIEAFNIPVLTMKNDKAKLEEKFLASCHICLERGAELIIPACMAVLPNLGHGAAERMAKKLGVPILDPSAITLKVAELAADLKLIPSKKAFPIGRILSFDG